MAPSMRMAGSFSLTIVLNQFDASLPLHLDVREVLRRQLGDRLLPFVIRRAPAVSEALAEGMTVVDYAPESPCVRGLSQCRNLAPHHRRTGHRRLPQCALE